MKKTSIISDRLICLSFVFMSFVAMLWGQSVSASNDVQSAKTGVFAVDTNSNGYATLSKGEVGAHNYAEYLTEEEKRFLQMGLLPIYYPTLKQCLDKRKPYTGNKGGLEASIALCKSYYPQAKGHFSENFGNVKHMLAWAKKVSENEKMLEVVSNCQVGDIILTGPFENSESGSYYIAMLTKGSFSHATIITEMAPPVIIEAMGVTPSPEASNKVRMTMWYDGLNFSGVGQLVRPTYGMDTATAQPIIDKAVAYVYTQLGKPYDYGFTNQEDVDAFYCSEVVSKAYAFADLNITDKNPDRDQIVVAIHAIIDGLEPFNKSELADEVANFAVQYANNPSMDMLQEFIVNTLVPSCKVFTDLFPDANARDKLNKAITKIQSGEAFTNFLKAQDKYEQQKAAGKFDIKFGLGFINEKIAQTAIVTAIVQDINSFLNDVGTNFKETLTMFSKILFPIYQNLGTCAGVLNQLGKHGMEIPEGIQTILDVTEWLADKREDVRQIPLIGGALADLMPGKGDGSIRLDFTSPSDLAYASEDFKCSWP